MKKFLIGLIIFLLICIAASESQWFPWINFLAILLIGFMAWIYHRIHRKIEIHYDLIQTADLMDQRDLRKKVIRSGEE